MVGVSEVRRSYPVYKAQRQVRSRAFFADSGDAQRGSAGAGSLHRSQLLRLSRVDWLDVQPGTDGMRVTRQGARSLVQDDAPRTRSGERGVGRTSRLTGGTS